MNPVRKIADLVHAVGGMVCVDGVAYAAHASIDVKALDVDFYLLSLYKLYGPHLGVMYGKREHFLNAKGQYFFFHGEDDIPLKLNPGAPNHELTAGSVGIADYIEALAAHHIDEPANDFHGRMRQVYGLFAKQEEALANRFLDYALAHPKLDLIGRATADHARRAPTFSFTIDGLSSQEAAKRLDAHGIACGAGDFYAPRVLQAVGIDPADGVVRCSMVHYNTVDEVDWLVKALDAIMP